MSSAWKQEGDSILLEIKAIPGSSNTAWALGSDGGLRIKVAAAPEDGKANAALIAFIAKSLSCRKAEVVLVSGERARVKRLSLPVHVLPALEAIYGSLIREA